MIHTGAYYTCISSNLAGFSYGDAAEVLSINIYADTIELRKVSDLSRHYVMISSFENYFVQYGNEFQLSFDDLLGKGLTGTKCECGCTKVYGPDCPRAYHSSFCPLYLK